MSIQYFVEESGNSGKTGVMLSSSVVYGEYLFRV